MNAKETEVQIFNSNQTKNYVKTGIKAVTKCWNFPFYRNIIEKIKFCIHIPRELFHDPDFIKSFLENLTEMCTGLECC